MSKIAFIGLGNMGSGMCQNLVKAGHEVTAFDLSAKAVELATVGGAIGTSTIAEAVTGAEAVISMLPAGKHVLSVYFGDDGVAKNASSGALFLDCSTIDVEDARAASDQANSLGFAMLDAPVSGGTAAAMAGTLTFMVGGSKAAFEKAEPMFSAMGQNIFHAGASGNGQVAKVANNMLLGISMIATSEAFSLAEKLGLDAQTFFDISSKASGQNWAMTSYCPAPGPVQGAPSNNDYQPGFAVAMMLKDLRLAATAAAKVNAEVRLGTAAEEIYSNLDERGFGGLDFSGIIKQIRGDL